MNRSRVGFLLVCPMIIGLVGFVLFPLLFSLGLSFYEWDGLSEARFVGLRNYDMLIRDPLVSKSLMLTMAYTFIALPLNILMGFVLAVLLNKDSRINQILRFGFYAPQLISGVPLMLLWLWIFNSKYGLINRSLATIGVAGPAWFENEHAALVAMILISLWGVGNSMLMFLAAFQRIPARLIEVIRLEGGSFWAELRYVILPVISPILFFLCVVGVIGYSQVFAQAFIITKGGPNNATLFFSYYVYQNAFSFLKMGYASAMAWFYFLLLMVITGIQFLLGRYWVHYDEMGTR